MRYPASNDIISINTCVISLLTSQQLTVFSRAVKHLWFSVVWSFWSFCFGLFTSRSFKFFDKMETSRFFEMTDEELIEFVEQENLNTKKITAYDVELSRNFIRTSNPGLLGSTSCHEL